MPIEVKLYLLWCRLFRKKENVPCAILLESKYYDPARCGPDPDDYVFCIREDILKVILDFNGKLCPSSKEWEHFVIFPNESTKDMFNVMLALS